MKDLMRPAGHSLRERIADINIDISASLVMISSICPLLLIGHIGVSYFKGNPETPDRILFTCISAVIIVGFGIKKLSKQLTDLRAAQLGLDGELAVAQELDQLMLDGCRVFHDIPYPYGNIDHVVISQSGVHTVNTKMRGKPKDAKNSDVTVDFDKGMMQFPDVTIPIPTGEAEREARWLSQVLSESTGTDTDAEPMLAFPGWYFKKRIGKGSVFVFNPTNPKRFFVRRSISISPERVRQISYQVEQLVRNVEPFQKNKSKRWTS